MTAGVDEGPVADERVVEVPRDADAGRAYELLACRRGRQLLGHALRYGRRLGGLHASGGRSRLRREDHRGRPRDRLAATGRGRIADQVRALSPEVGAHTELGGRRVVVWKAVPRTSLSSAGEARDRLVVPCGRGFLEITGVAGGRSAAHDGPGLPARRRPPPGATVGAGAVSEVAPARARRLRSASARDSQPGGVRSCRRLPGPEFAHLAARDRALAYELATGTIKRRNSLDRVIGAFSDASSSRLRPEGRSAAARRLPAPLPRPRAGPCRGKRCGGARQGSRPAHRCFCECGPAQGRGRRPRRA